MEAIFFPQSSEYVGEFTLAGNSRPKGFGVDLETIRSFRELRGLFKNSAKPMWCRATFEIHSDGKFKMNWGYDHCDENGFTHFDEEKESERKRQIQIRQGFAT